MATPAMIIQPGTPQATKLQDAIQAQLVERGYSTEGDEVMAEYVLVMLANRKTREQIDSELNELIGSEYDSALTETLFSLVAEHYPPPPPAAPASASPIPSDTGSRPANGRGGPGAFGIFGAAMSGVGQKRPAGDLIPGRDGPPQQRMRIDSDPRMSRGGDGRNGPRNGAPTGPRNGVPSIFERAGVDRATGAVNPAFQAQGRGLPPNGMAMPNGAPGPNGPMPGFFPFPGPYGMPFFPPGFAGPMPAFPMAPQFPPVPSKPADDSLCKFGTECKNAYCRYSHPSPVATKDSGLVLSTDPCDKQLACDNQDCPKSHVSQQARDPSKSVPAPEALKPAMPPMGMFPFGAPPMMPPQAGSPAGARRPAANPGAQPCKFGAGCTRPGCYFSHPRAASSGGSTACRYGAGCTRADCHFSHPPGRKIPGRSASGNMSSSFAGKMSSPAPAAPELSAVEKTAMSERLKRFADSNGGDAERIIPGAEEAEQQAAHAAAVAAATAVKPKTPTPAPAETAA